MMSLAFNEPVLLKMLRFVETYGQVWDLVQLDSADAGYQQYVHPLALFMLAFKHNLWVSNLDEFVKNQFFDKSDILTLINLSKPLIINLLRKATQLEVRKQQLPIVDEFVLMAASQLLHLLHE